MADYRGAPLATLPKTLDPDEYFNLSPEFRRAEEERAAIRSNLKRQYQMQLNDPKRQALIEDPALTRWVYARSNTYDHFRPTRRTSLMGALFAITPLVILFFGFRAERGRREEKIKAGTLERKYNMSN